MFELKKDLKMFEEVDRYLQLIKSKEASIQLIRSNIKTLIEDAVDKDELEYIVKNIFSHTEGI